MAAAEFHVQDHLPALQVVVPLLGSVLAAMLRRGVAGPGVALAFGPGLAAEGIAFEAVA